MRDILPELFIAPRGLITVLLFFGIPVMYQQSAFNSGILLYSILLTGIAMTVAMVLKRRSPESVVEMNYRDFEALDKEVERLKGQRNS